MRFPKISRENKYVIIGLILVFIFLWWTRYELCPVGEGRMYRLDRATGDIDCFAGSVILHTRKAEDHQGPQLAPEAAPAPAPEPGEIKP
jgi:hypothetical protein